MNQKEVLEALVRGTARDADIEAELLRDAFANFSRQHDFKPGMVVRERAGCSLLRKSGNGFFVILELRDVEPPFDVEPPHGTAGFVPLDMLVGKVNEDGDLFSLWEDHRRFEPVPEEVLRRR
jgi:hypothetical protein